MKTGQTATRLLRCHYLRNFRADLLKTTLSIKPIGGFLNLGSAHNHLCEAERARFCLCTIKHALCNTQAAVTFIKVHSAKLRVAPATAFNTKRPNNPISAFHDPKGVTLGVGKDLEKLIELTVDCHRDVLLK